MSESQAATVPVNIFDKDVNQEDLWVKVTLRFT